MKKIISFVLVIIFVLTAGIHIFPQNQTKTEAENAVYNMFSAANKDIEFEINAESAVLMEASTGTVLYAKNENEARSPASVTKIMTLLLVAEAIDANIINLTDAVTVSSYAASMGGSQVFLEEGEKITVEELLKSTIIASANDSAVALAELVAGSESLFVNKMNIKAMSLGLSSTNFENVTGLDDTTTNHVTSALDIAIMSKELIKHDIILKYSSMWQDSIRNGEFILTNTNRLVRYYDGCNGLKTGSTDKAGYCVSTTAKRDDMQLIAVVMGSPTRDIRNECAKKLLDYGFSGYSLYNREEVCLGEVPVIGGTKNTTKLYSAPFSVLVEKGAKIEPKFVLPESLTAEIKSEASVSKIEYIMSGEKIGESEIYAKEDIPKIGYFDLLYRMILSLIGKKQ